MLTNLPLSRADCLEILEASTSRNPGPVLACNEIKLTAKALLKKSKI
jgi:hypothetical protein